MKKQLAFAGSFALSAITIVIILKLVGVDL
ncbi:hypothetical protein U719_07445 [Exiguobacterium sp. MH3]|nr:hypothetical protein U719_07445 [Exiguobacterium sp. MH3]